MVSLGRTGSLYGRSVFVLYFPFIKSTRQRKTLAKYAPRLRGFTCYPDGARGGQPLTSVPYSEAKHMLGVEFEEAVSTHDICDISGKGGSCGV
jgi:hypothetical protein